MWGFISVSIAFAALAVIAFSDLRQPLAGLSPGELAALLALFALAVALVGNVYARFRHTQTWLLSSLVSALIVLTPVVFYARSDDFYAYLDRYIGEISPGRVVAGPHGEAITAKLRSGGFMLTGTVDGYTTRMLFDTGATTVVLRSETAAALGINVDELDFSLPVYTANGRTLAAPFKIGTITVGTITERDVRAMIAQKGALTDDLLGMSFMDRLESYEVRGNRLILRGRSGS